MQLFTINWNGSIQLSGDTANWDTRIARLLQFSPTVHRIQRHANTTTTDLSYGCGG
jgi:hypothetical protein